VCNAGPASNSRSSPSVSSGCSHGVERRLVGRARVDRLAQLVAHLALPVEDHVLLAREVAEERAPRDVGRGGNLVDRRTVEAALGEQPQRGLRDLLAAAQLVAFAQARRHGQKYIWSAN
jgi:hypothetical protein